MRAKTVGVLSALGMSLTSVGVYSLTASREARWTPPPEEAPSASVTPAPAVFRGAQLAAKAGPLAVEARLAKPSVKAGEATEQLLYVRVTPAAGARPGARSPVRLAIVLDRSGSMKGPRLANAKRAAALAADRLVDGDTVSVVAFDTQHVAVVPRTVIGPATRAAVRAAIEGIKLGGDTCISCGLEEGLAQLGAGSADPPGDDGVPRSLLLLSDGDANSGLREVSEFQALGARARSRGVSITSVGVDVSYNDKLLVPLSRESNGRHFFAPDPSVLEKVFDEVAGRFASSVATGVEVEIELPEGVELVKLFDRPFRQAGRRLIVPLGSFGAGDDKTILASVKLPARPEGEIDVARVELRLRDTTSGGASASVQGKLASLSGVAATQLDPDVLVRLQRSETAAALDEANRLYDEGKLTEAGDKLRAARGKAAALATAVASASGSRALGEDLETQSRSLGDAEKNFGSLGPTKAPSRPGAKPAHTSPAGEIQHRRSSEKLDAFMH